MAPSAESAAPARAAVPNARARVSSMPAPFFFFQTGPTVETFNGACATAQSDFTLGNVICVKVNGVFTPSRVQLVNPYGYAVDRVEISDDGSEQTVTFTLPSQTTISTDDLTFDNRGTWRVTLVDIPSAGVRSSAPVVVRDPEISVANVQVLKRLVGNAQATAGTNIQTVVRVYNAGPDAAANVVFTDTPPANTTFVSIQQTGGPAFDCTTAGGVSTCTGASVGREAAADFIVTYAVSGAVADSTDLTTSASATTETTETTTADNGSSDTATSDNPAPPSCTLSCPSNVTVEAAPGQSSAAVNFDAPTTGGTCGGVTTDFASGSVFPVGTTQVTATASGGVSCTFFVTVTPAQDTDAPSLSCPGDIAVDESSPSANSATVNYSVTAADDSGSVTVNCDPPSGSVFPAGTTEVTCTATDASGNTAECSFNVTVNQVGCDLDANSPPPTPDVASLPAITRACSVTLLAADDPTAKDACGSTISGETTNDRFYDVPGTYTVVWTYTDGAGHTATQNQTITILPDNSAPVPDAPSLPTVTGECTASITGEPPTATDNCAGSGIEGVALDPLTYNVAGTYTVRWRFTDPAGNSAIQNQTVVVTDTHAPTVALNGPSAVTVECHTSYADAGATASDNCSPAPTPTVTSNNVNIDVPGTYQVVWSATDAGGNTTSATRTVNVVDTTKPVITLNGANPVVVLLHGTYTEAGATAADSCAGSFAATPSGAVNTHAVGTYVVTYNATDPSGNAADPVTRTVKVIYDFSGFFSPINNLPTVNQMNAGRTIPVKFSLAGNQGLGIMAAGSPYSQQVNCSTSAPISNIEEAETSGNSTLTYDAGSNQYQYNWKTEKSWAGQCRVLSVALNDGTTHTAAFKFK